MQPASRGFTGKDRPVSLTGPGLFTPEKWTGKCGTDAKAPLPKKLFKYSI